MKTATTAGTGTVTDAFANRKAKETEKKNALDGNKQKPELLPAFVTRFTQEKLDAWKAEHAPRELICVGAEGKFAVLRPPLADDLSEYMTAIGTNGMSKAVIFIMETLWIDGDYELIEDEELFIAVFLQINNILEGKKADYFRF